MSRLNREDLELRFALFSRFGLADHKAFSQRSAKRFSIAGAQLNRYKALFSLLAGVSAALAGFITQNWFLNQAACAVDAAPGYCTNLRTAIAILAVLAIVLPAVAAFFNTLAELYRFDSLAPVMETTAENFELADALSPMDDMDDVMYAAAVQSYAETTLRIMREEARQYDQAVRIKPKDLEMFIEEARQKAVRYQDITGVATRFDVAEDEDENENGA